MLFSSFVVPVVPATKCAYIPTLCLAVPVVVNSILPSFTILKFSVPLFFAYIPAEESPVILISPVFVEFVFLVYIPAEAPPSIVISPVFLALPLSDRIPTEADVALVSSDKIFPSFVISESLFPNIPTEPVPFNSIFPAVAAFVTVAVSANIPTVSSPSDVIFLLFVTTTSAFAAVPFLA